MPTLAIISALQPNDFKSNAKRPVGGKGEETPILSMARAVLEYYLSTAGTFPRGEFQNAPISPTYLPKVSCVLYL